MSRRLFICLASISILFLSMNYSYALEQEIEELLNVCAGKSSLDSPEETIKQLSDFGIQAAPYLIKNLYLTDSEADLYPIKGGFGSFHYDLKSCSAEALVKIGPDAVPSLIDALREAPAKEIIFIFERIGDKRAVPVLIELIKNNNIDENYLDIIANALVSITGESFGFQSREAREKDMTFSMSWSFPRDKSDREKALKLWDNWLKKNAARDFP